MFDRLQTAFQPMTRAVNQFRPSPGNFQTTGVNGTIPDKTGQGWDANVKTAFAHPGNPMRQGLGKGLMGIAPLLMGGKDGQGAGGMGAFGGILPQLMSMRGDTAAAGAPTGGGMSQFMSWLKGLRGGQTPTA